VVEVVAAAPVVAQAVAPGGHHQEAAEQPVSLW
jgi:hypothetical protein